MTISVTPEPTPQPDWLQRNLLWVSRMSWASYALVGTSFVAALLTFLILTGSTPIDETSSTVRRYITVIDALLLAGLIALVIRRLRQLRRARATGGAGARLHGRLVTIFSGIAAIPVVLTAGAAGVLMNLAMEAWFNAPIQSVVASSVEVTNTYFDEHKEKLNKEIGFAAANLNELTTLDFATARFQKYVEAIADRLNAEVKVFTRRGQEIASAGGGLTARVDVPTEEDFERAGRGETFVRVDDDRSQLRAMNKLSVQEEQDVDLFLVVARDVNPTILDFLQNSKKASDDYRRLEQDRNEVLATFSLIFGLIAFVILFAAIWLGLGTANRIVTPIGRLIGAAERISEGDLGARVMLARDDDELATLGKAFNRMSAQLQSQRNELIESHRQTEQRRRFTEAVLSGVSAGVIGLDGQGKADVANRSAFTLLSANRDDIIGRPLVAAIPEVEELIQKAMTSNDGRGQSHVDIARNGKTRNFAVTVTRERAGEDESGYVVTFDDITDLITAQRTSAWADVARRIAHEIKNPLTPIQLSAERLRRKYKKEIASDPEIFEQCTQTIIRQVGDIGRMVDEFSSFARMPQPVMRDEDISELIKHSVFLQRVAHQQITYALLVPDTPVMVECDGRLVSQALTNVLKNASEAVRAAFGLEGEEGQLREGGRIEIRLVEENQRLSIEVIDNGIGLPKEDRNRLTEPYVTKRAKGTGLGLAIVRKIMEDHKGALSLEDAPKTDETGATRESGAMVRLTFLRRLSAVKLAGE